MKEFKFAGIILCIALLIPIGVHYERFYHLRSIKKRIPKPNQVFIFGGEKFKTGTYIRVSYKSKDYGQGVLFSFNDKILVIENTQRRIVVLRSQIEAISVRK